MKAIHRFTVVPALPERLTRLRDIAMNLWWSWDPDATSLFHRIDAEAWEAAHHGPIRLLGTVSQERLAALAEDSDFLAHLDRVAQRLDEHMASSGTWFATAHGDGEPPRIAHFSAEYGVTDSLPIYSGGLGVLAGDHLKSASDLGIPLVGVGLLYREGYFRQSLNTDGWQQECFPENDFHTMALTPMQTPDGEPLTVTVECPEPVRAQIWRAQVGRVPLYLLDADIEGNRPEDRAITARLYGGDGEMRIRQELLLGVGGPRALDALGIEPSVCHLNEGHAAFLTLERARVFMQRDGLSREEAWEAVRAETIFTTHTPVPAGHDIFSADLFVRHLEPMRQALGMEHSDLLALGRRDPRNAGEPFNMTLLGMRLSSHRNGVSALHGEVSRAMWTDAWPGFPPDEVPITSLTNGVHIRTWISADLAALLDRHLDPRWVAEPGDPAVWEEVERIPDDELWRVREQQRERLVDFARRRLRGFPADEVLDPDVLTVGFARRFATYKRGTLLFHDPERLARILNNPERPVQIIFAGKAHPADDGGKDLIRQIVHHCRAEQFRHRIVFLEDYDMDVARWLVRGVDVWLNTPRRGLEASGTSGMKAAANGALNLSVPDGWWCEAHDGENGWNIGDGETHGDHASQDQIESHAIYRILEREIAPLFHQRDTDGVPRAWVARMRHTMRTICPVFSTNRMVREYTERFYLPAVARRRDLAADGWRRARDLAAWKERVSAAWSEVRIVATETTNEAEFKVGESLKVEVRVHLGALAPSDIAVEVQTGPLDSQDRFSDPRSVALPHVRDLGQGDHLFADAVICRNTGQHGLRVRVVPRHADLACPQEMRLVTWG